MESSIDFALLAPVPEEHLDAGPEVVAASGFVAYGSRKWELFRQIDDLRGDQTVPVLIYPSHDHEEGKLDYLIKWTGWYIGSVESDSGEHPDGMKHRPETTLKYEDDQAGYWAVYWHVNELAKLSDSEIRAISSLQSYKSGQYWKAGTPPRGPEIVARPA
ncbi:hypothetical protein [Botrimarina mediterranea]|uniref:Uncharacterized protein n=1 Tax=Botrimarina mediterranea TaxID=2528022 RepID=A0A518K7Q6_9BACT|nr:hypothetical protein [Botrimarina mediterranea]QDV73807.1 hypothetical protein Spa11_20060 [Botrimarina mediterranea]